MEIVSRCRYIRSSAQKFRLVINMIRDKKVTKALDILNYINKKAAIVVKKNLKSAIANAQHNNRLSIDDLKIAKIVVDNGPSIKRMMTRAKGRSDRIMKRTSHLTIVLSDDQ